MGTLRDKLVWLGRRPRVVTLGGGHGHATLLRALARLDCDITAIVTLADDGGCSGRLRRELGMPPPGDMRRCLGALARRQARAELLERRSEEGRCYGNLLLARLTEETGSLSRASGLCAKWLDARGTVYGASAGSSTLVGRDARGSLLSGESAIARANDRLASVEVSAPSGPCPEALVAISAADLVFAGPGSLYTSILACLLSPRIAETVCAARAPIVYVANLCEEGRQTSGMSAEAHLAEIERHLEERIGRRRAMSMLLEGARGHRAGPDGTERYHALLSEPPHREHSPSLLMRALRAWLGLPLRFREPLVSASMEVTAQQSCDVLRDAARRAVAG
jgi:uncharacterized cofD-like protein